jgi:predicted alpha/beta hydrolase family esterase
VKVDAWQKAFEETALAVEAGRTVVVKAPGKGKAKAVPRAESQDMGEPVSLFFAFLISSRLTHYLAYGRSHDYRSSFRSEVCTLCHARHSVLDGDHGKVPPVLQRAQQVRIQ